MVQIFYYISNFFTFNKDEDQLVSSLNQRKKKQKPEYIANVEMIPSPLVQQSERKANIRQGRNWGTKMVRALEKSP